jgi:K+-transporting ATPase KdpF subunit
MCVVARSYIEEKLMSLESILGLVVAALLLVYLTYALLRPEKF